MMILQEQYENLAIVKLNRSITNAINLQFVQDLTSVLQKGRQDDGIGALILTSNNDKFFSIGFDIPQLFDLSKDEFRVFYQAFNQLCLDLYTFPKPVMAAIGGHAIAGGCILALCCDYRYMAEGRKLMGLNEIKLGVPVPYVADCILRQLIGARRARDVMEMGEFYQSVEALNLGMVDRIITMRQVMPDVITRAKTLSALPQEAFAIIKQNRVESVEAEIRSRLAEKEGLFIDRWFSIDARERLRAVMEKF